MARAVTLNSIGFSIHVTYKIKLTLPTYILNSAVNNNKKIRHCFLQKYGMGGIRFILIDKLYYQKSITFFECKYRKKKRIILLLLDNLLQAYLLHFHRPLLFMFTNHFAFRVL